MAIFGGNVQQTVNRMNSGLEAIPPDSIISITLTDARLSTLAYLNAGPEERDSILTLKMSGDQTTILPIQGGGWPVSINPKFLNKLLYLGPVRPRLSLSAELVESRESIRQELENAGRGTQALGQIIAHAPLLTGNIASAGLGLLASLLAFIENQIRDAVECTAFTELSGPFYQDEPISIQYSTDEKTILELNLLVQELPAPAFREKISFAIQSPSFSFIPDACLILNSFAPSPDSTKIGTRYVKQGEVRVSASNYVSKNFPVFHLEAGSGIRSLAMDRRIDSHSGFIPRLAWESLELFDVTAGRAVVPLSLSFSLHSSEVNVEGLSELLNKGFDLAQATQPEFPGTDLKKATPSVIDFVSEFSQKSFSLYSFDGAVLLTDNDSPSLGNGHLVLKQTAADSGIWQVLIEKTVTWAGVPVGQLSFELVASLVGN